MSSKSNFSKKILKNLAQKPAILVDSMREEDVKKTNALKRTLKNLVENGLVDIHKSENQKYAKITNKGKNKLTLMNIGGEEALVPKTWDGSFRIILLDLPEERKQERESLRYLLKKAGFVCLKNSVWISPLPYEFLFQNIKKDLGLTTELMIIVTSNIDEETRKSFFENFKV